MFIRYIDQIYMKLLLSYLFKATETIREINRLHTILFVHKRYEFVFDFTYVWQQGANELHFTYIAFGDVNI